MDCSCNCLGVATAARVPVKRYNLLVPDIYPVVEPPFDRPLGVPIERKFKKLGEYLERNEHRAPKVGWRRLQRRPGGRNGWRLHSPIQPSPPSLPFVCPRCRGA